MWIIWCRIDMKKIINQRFLIWNSSAILLQTSKELKLLHLTRIFLIDNFMLRVLRFFSKTLFLERQTLLFSCWREKYIYDNYLYVSTYVYLSGTSKINLSGSDRNSIRKFFFGTSCYCTKEENNHDTYDVQKVEVIM